MIAVSDAEYGEESIKSLQKNEKMNACLFNKKNYKGLNEMFIELCKLLAIKNKKLIRKQNNSDRIKIIKLADDAEETSLYIKYSNFQLFTYNRVISNSQIFSLHFIFLPFLLSKKMSWREKEEVGQEKDQVELKPTSLNPDEQELISELLIAFEPHSLPSISITKSSQHVYQIEFIRKAPTCDANLIDIGSQFLTPPNISRWLDSLNNEQ